MAKRCRQCGFENNPDDANYCGRCGYNIAAYGHVWKTYDSSVYSTYVSSGNTVISNSQLRELRDYERKAKESLWNKVKEWIGDVWEWICDKWEDVKYNFDEYGWPWVWGIGSGGIVFLGLFVMVKTCSEKKLTSIEIDGKYGIGYDEDNMLLAPTFDIISRECIGNQWIVYDTLNNLKGLAYVTDSIQNVIAPHYTEISRGSSHYALLRKSPKQDGQSNGFEYVAYDGKILNEEPFNSVSAVPDISNPGVFREKKDDYNHMLYSLNLEMIGPSFYTLVECWKDSVLVGRNNDESIIYDYNGNRLNSTPIYDSRDFSEGVAWAYVSKENYGAYVLSLIDKYGNPRFNVNAERYPNPVEFSDGVGWYKSRLKGDWVAVDKDGRELFDIDAYSVHPFTMDIAPIYKGTNYADKKLGFVDKSGRVVIPFKYESRDSQPEFDRDSLMTVTLEGVRGKLHRNGTFSPEN